MKAETMALEARVPEPDTGTKRAAILTTSYRLSRIEALGQTESEEADPASGLECCRL